MQELLSMRNYTSKTFLNTDGSKTFEGHCGHIHYPDAQGNLIDVDYAFEDMGTYWQMKKANYHIYIAKDFAVPQLIRFDNKLKGANHTIYYEPHSIWYVDKTNPNTRNKVRDAQSVTGVLTGNKIYYTNAFGNGIDFQITLRRSGFKKEVVIPVNLNLNPPANRVPVVLFRYQATGLILKSNDSAQDWDEDSYYESEEGFTIREAVSQYKSHILPAYIEDSDPQREKQKLKIFWEKRNGSLWQAKVIPLAFLDSAVYPIRFDTLTNYDPTTGDGTARRSGTDTTWDACHNGASGTGNTDTAEVGVISVEVYAKYNLRRAFFPINTAAIPDAATISSAVMKIWVNSKTEDVSDAYSYVALVAPTTQASTTALENDDYVDCAAVHPGGGKADIIASDEIDIGDTTIGAYNDWTLNTLGKTNISKTGITMLGARVGNDIEDVTIGSVSDNVTNEINVSWSEETSGNEDPYLAVTYLNNYTLACDTGSYAVTGVAASPLKGFHIDADTGSYAVTGVAMTPLAARKLACDTGSYAITGVAALFPISLAPSVIQVILTFGVPTVSVGAAVKGSELHMFLDLSLN
jgi:hypothetical protein